QKGLQNYGDSKQIRYLSGNLILPIGKVEKKNPMFRASKANIYTPEGAEYLQQYMNPPILLMQMYILKHPVGNRNVEYNDNRLSLVSGQHGKDKVTGEPLDVERAECHHIKPRNQGGNDSYKNLILVDSAIHELIHMKDEETIMEYIWDLKLYD
ncbi:MAG: HNH endonuclease, partial [Desulfovibrionaceae bacterium]|nr:HNH endonuclease [Desulfovibrionaceae bacterium]